MTIQNGISRLLKVLIWRRHHLFAAAGHFTALRQRGSWQARTEAKIHITCQAETYDVTASVTAWDGDRPVRTQVMRLSLTWDHRVLDGGPAAQFLAEVKALLEAPYRLLL